MIPGPQVPGPLPSAQVEAALQFRVDVNPGSDSDGKPCVVLVVSLPGAHTAVVLHPDQVGYLADELVKAAATARSGLQIARPDQLPPTNGRKG